MWNELSTFMGSVLPTRIEMAFVAVSSAVMAALDFAFGTIGLPIQWLAVFATADYITGNLKAFKAGEWCSNVAHRGAVKKFFLFAVVSLSHGLDIVCGVDFMMSGAIIAFSLSEVGSTIENIDSMGHGHIVPEFFRSKLKTLHMNHQKKMEMEGEKQDGGEDSKNLHR